MNIRQRRAQRRQFWARLKERFALDGREVTFIVLFCTVVLLAGQLAVSIQIKQAFNSLEANHKHVYTASQWLVEGGIEDPN